VVTAAGVLLIIVGALGILGGLLVFALSTVAAIFTILAVILLAVGALELYAGIQVLRLREIGRKIGLILAAISAVLNLIQIAKVPGTSIVSIAIDAFIIWALWTNAQYFTA